MGFWIFGKKESDKVQDLKENLKNSFSNIKNDILSVHRVLENFKDKHIHHENKHEKHDERLTKLEEEIEKIYDFLENSNRRLERRSIVHERSIAFNRSNQSFMNVQSLENLKNNLTPAQKNVLQLLDSAETPLEYEEIARELGLSIITIRRHVNDIKKMGFNVGEKTNINKNRKLFFLEKKIKKAIRKVKKE
jgi:DNA-binding MarR family transcriptional regulator